LRALLLRRHQRDCCGCRSRDPHHGKAVHQHIRGKSGVRFGRLTGALVVADIAVSVAAIGFALSIADQRNRGRVRSVRGHPAAEYLAVQFRLPDDGPLNGGAPARRDAHRAHGGGAARTRRESRTEPGISAVAVGSALPRMEHQSAPFEIEAWTVRQMHHRKWVRMARVDVGFFEALGHRVVAGRDFTRADVESVAGPAIVNPAFVTRTLEGKDFIGRRVRFTRAKRSESAVVLRSSASSDTSA
jgi:hypothetical protein